MKRRCALTLPGVPIKSPQHVWGFFIKFWTDSSSALYLQAMGVRQENTNIVQYSKDRRVVPDLEKAERVLRFPGFLSDIEVNLVKLPHLETIFITPEGQLTIPRWRGYRDRQENVSL